MTRAKLDKEYIPGKGFSKEDWDAVESPPLTDEQLAKARPFSEAFPAVAEDIRRNMGGRPRSDSPKKSISIRFDQDVVDYFKSGGDGWQSRMNDALRKVAGL